MSGENTNNTYTNVSDLPTYTNVSDLPTMSEITSPAYVPVEDANKDGKKVDLNKFYTKTQADSAFVSSSGYVATDNNYTTEEKTKLDGIETGAQANVKPDWSAAAGSDAEILNKPTIPTVGKLNTTYTTSLPTNSGESLSGTINLHKVAKSGKYTDLSSLPKIDTTNSRSLDPISADVTGSYALHKISRTGSYADLLNKPYLTELSLADSRYGECVLNCDRRTFTVEKFVQKAMTWCDYMGSYAFDGGTADYLESIDGYVTGIRVMDAEKTAKFYSIDFGHDWFKSDSETYIYKLDDVDVIRIIYPFERATTGFYDAYIKFYTVPESVGLKTVKISFNPAFAKNEEDEWPPYDPSMEDTDEPLICISQSSKIDPSKDGVIHIIDKYFEIIQP